MCHASYNTNVLRSWIFLFTMKYLSFSIVLRTAAIHVKNQHVFDSKVYTRASIVVRVQHLVVPRRAETQAPLRYEHDEDRTVLDFPYNVVLCTCVRVYQFYSYHVSGIYFWYAYQVPRTRNTFRDDVRTRSGVSAATAHRRGLGSLRDPVPQPSGVGRGPRAKSKRVFDAGRDMFCSK